MAAYVFILVNSSPWVKLVKINGAAGSVILKNTLCYTCIHTNSTNNLILTA
jgi:hypothetical protein